jgi:predicted  nucleic acid-binding Zn-ribbon protein
VSRSASRAFSSISWPPEATQAHAGKNGVNFQSQKQNRKAQMSVPRHTVHDHPDLESTAELPVLDVAALEATQDQIAPAAAEATLPDLRPVVAAPAVPAAVSGAYRGPLEEDLKSLSASLRTFEERLAAQGKRSTALESELKTLREAHSAAEKRANGLSGELAEGRSALAAAEAQINGLMQLLEERESTLRSSETRSTALEARLAERERALASAELQLREARLNATARLETLQSLEARRGVFHTLLNNLDGEVRQRDTRATELQRGLEASAERIRGLEAELTDSRSRAEGLAAQVQSLTTALTGKGEELLVLRRADDELRQSMRSLTENSVANLERSKAAELEARARADGLARELAAAVARQRELEAAQADRQRELEVAQGRRELETQQRITALETELTELRSQLVERANALTQAEARHAEHIARLGPRGERLEELEGQIADYAKAIAALQAELEEGRERRLAAEGDVRAAEVALLRLEGEIRIKSARIDELTKLNDDWRETLEAARQSIAERDSLIRRLEGEAAHSATLLDNIQHSIRSLESSSGVADETPAQGATRLLVRSEGGAEVVHVLGRKTSIGRTPDNDVQIDTKFVSRHHAVILAGNVHTIIEDLNSTNGVVVNGQRVTRHSLKDGDAIVVGNAQFRFAVRPARNVSEP